MSNINELRANILDAQRTNFRRCLGKVLTIIDASISDTQQRKALKNLIEQAIWSEDNPYYIRKSILKYLDDTKTSMTPEELRGLKGETNPTK